MDLKGLLGSAAVDAWIEVYQDGIGPKIGARLVARAWCDDEFRKRLLDDVAALIFPVLTNAGRSKDHTMSHSRMRWKQCWR